MRLGAMEKKMGDGNIPALLRTHPMSDARVEAIEAHEPEVGSAKWTTLVPKTPCSSAAACNMLLLLQTHPISDARIMPSRHTRLRYNLLHDKNLIRRETFAICDFSRCCGCTSRRMRAWKPSKLMTQR